MEYLRGISRKLTESTTTTFGSGNTSFMPYLASIIVVIFILAIILYIVYNSYQDSPTKLVKGPVDLFAPPSPIVVSRTDTKAQMGGSYTLSFYIRIDAVPDMRAGSTPIFTWPGVWDMGYNAAQEQLIWTVQQTANAPAQVILPTVSLQRWVQVVITFEGRTMDLYVNGKLVKSETLINVPPASASSITIVPGGIIGQIAWVQLWSRRRTIRETGTNYVDTSDSQGRPYLTPDFFKAITSISIPNLFCPSGKCFGTQPTACASQTWEFPYA